MNRKETAWVMAAAAAALLWVSAAALPEARAQEAPPGGFTFRTVRPPPPGTQKRLVFQQDAASWAESGAEAFWTAPGAGAGVSPRRPLGPLLAAAGPAPTGAMGAAERLMQNHGAHFLRAAAESRLTLPFILAVAVAESGGDSQALSARGAQGLMQLMPATAEELGADAFAPAEAIPAAAAHLSALLARFDEDMLAAIAAYNAGAGAVARHGGAPPYAETRAYAPRVLALFGALRALCLPPPETARAACRPSAALSPPARLRSSP